jgi:hypothetical protein
LEQEGAAVSARRKQSSAEPAPESYEKLGGFYLGREFDLETGETSPAPLVYDAKDLTTHGVIVGMTGSGKTPHRAAARAHDLVY